ncbi:glycosyltransferase family 39 protein [Candidatus Woesearchaeota archaeon]|nr:glycosyltransferase family 39 protein [Candidatus Woesearchaeota archaeon]
MNNKTKIILVLIVLLISLVLQVFLASKDTALLWDENAYLANAKSYFEPVNYDEDFRFPFLELYIVPVWFVFGISDFSAHLVVILFSVGTLFLFYLVSKFYIKRWRVSFSLLVFLAFSKLFLFWSFRVYTDIPSIFFFLLSWYLFLYHWKYKQRNNWLLFFSGMAAIFAFNTRFPAGGCLFLGVILLCYKEWNRLLYFALGVISILVPWSIRNIILYGNPMWDFFAQYSVIATYNATQPLSVLLLFIYVSFGLSLLFIPFSFIKLFKERSSKNYQSLILFVLVLIPYYFFFVSLKLERYVIALFPILLLLVGIGLEYISSLKLFNEKNYLYLLYFVFGLFLILTLVSNGVVFFKDEKSVVYCQTNSSLQQSIDYAKEHILPSDLIISNAWPWFGYYGNFRVLAPWTDDVDELLIYEKIHAWLFMYSKYDLYSQTLMDKGSCFKNFTDSCGYTVTLCRLEK